MAADTDWKGKHNPHISSAEMKAKGLVDYFILLGGCRRKVYPCPQSGHKIGAGQEDRDSSYSRTVLYPFRGPQPIQVGILVGIFSPDKASDILG